MRRLEIRMIRFTSHDLTILPDRQGRICTIRVPRLFPFFPLEIGEN